MIFGLFAFFLATNLLVAAEELTSLEKRSHNSGPEWTDHCWDHAPNHIMDPFCALLLQKKNCSAAPEIDNGSHSKKYNMSVGSKVSYVCNEGYSLSGPEVVTCENKDDGAKWSQTPVCNKVQCPAIPDIVNGYHETTNSAELGTTVQYFCNDGYELLDKDTISCVLNDTTKYPVWTKPLPECIGIICSRPVITNGVILLPGMVLTTAFPDTTVMTTTTELPDNTTDTPAETTTTSVPDISNETTTLPDASNATNAQPDILNASTSIPDILNDTSVDMADTPNDADVSNYTTTALPDTSNDTSTDSTGTANETSTDIPDNSNDTTTAMPDISNETSATTTEASTSAPVTTTQQPTTTLSPYAYIVNETFVVNDTIIYQCNPGYTIMSRTNPGYLGNTLEATCRFTTTERSNKILSWSSTVSCVPECPDVPGVVNAQYTRPSNARNLEGSTVVYNCLDGFEMVGPSNVTCLPTGSWSKTPICRGCKTAPEVAHGTHTAVYNTTINSTISYVCNDGFSMIGLEVITCNSFNEPPYGKWSEPPLCTRACGMVPVVENGVHTDPDGNLIGANITYTCLDGFEMTGSSNVVCQSSGNWSQTPVCEKVCTRPPVIPNSVITRYTYNETDKIRLVCEERYTLIGNDTLECDEGQWSTPFPYCQCEIKPIDIVFIIDGSGSLGLHGFRQTLRFLVDMVSRFPIETTNFGLVAFSTGTFPQFYLNEYVNDTIGLVERIQNTTYPTGGTHTYAGLEFARTDMFQEKNGMRPNVSHTAIVVTDGHSDNFNETAKQAELLKNAGVTVYSVGVGLTEEHELQLIASDDSYVFTVDNYDTIDEITGPLAGVTCASTHGIKRDGGFVSQ